MVNMLSIWRRKKRSSTSAENSKKQKQELSELMIPTNFQCPISLELMKDPVTLSTGITYDRENIEKWIDNGNRTCPKTNQVLKTGDFLELEPIPNHTLRKVIQEWCVENKEYGIDRIPTPRIPISSHEVKKILAGVSAAGNQKDGKKCKELVGMIKTEAKQSERNKKRFLANGINGILCSTFIAFSNSVDVLEEILSALATFLHRGSDSKNYSILGSMDSLTHLVRFLNSGNLSARRNAVLVLIKVISSINNNQDLVVQIQGFVQGLVNLIQEPICPNTTKVTLVFIYQLIISSRTTKIKKRLVEMGFIELLLEMLVDSDKSLSEKGLGILKELCSSNEDEEEGRRRMYGHALAVPVLVKKILRVSDLVNQFSVSILWEIACNNNGDNNDVLVRVIELGGFQKMLLMIQVGCDEKTKEKVSDLLRVMNRVGRDSLELKNLSKCF